MRIDGRRYNELRPLKIITDYTKYAEGSVLIEQGDTKVICTASVEDTVPRHIKGTGKGWITAEYSMLPRANRERNSRDISKLKLAGRSAEIQRLIGRSLRAVVDLSAFGENVVTVDCDVIQGDGGTRCASITGGFVAMYLAFERMVSDNYLKKSPIIENVAALSTGIIRLDGRDQPVVDMCYEEDCTAVADFNIIMTSSGRFVEVQGTGEGRPYTSDEFANVLKVTTPAIYSVIDVQKEVLGIK